MRRPLTSTAKALLNERRRKVISNSWLCSGVALFWTNLSWLRYILTDTHKKTISLGGLQDIYSFQNDSPILFLFCFNTILKNNNIIKHNCFSSVLSWKRKKIIAYVQHLFLSLTVVVSVYSILLVWVPHLARRGM